MFFDNPALYGTWTRWPVRGIHRIPGGVGRRWSEGICAAVWRVLVPTEPDNVYSHNFAVPGLDH